MFSFSQLSQWDKCRYAWYLTYVENLTSAGAKGRPLSFGSLIHESLAVMYNVEEPVSVKGLLAQKVNEAETDLSTVVDVGRLMDRYEHDYAPYNDKGWRVISVEDHFELTLITPMGREFVFQGYVDLLIELQGKLIPVEHKSYNSRPWSPNEIQMDIQTTLYCLAMEQKYQRPITTAIYNFLNSYPYKNIQTEPTDKLFKRASVFRSPHEQAFVIAEVGRTVDQILDAQEAGLDPFGDLLYVDLSPYKKSLGKACSMCQFQTICLSEMKGIPTVDLKKSLYKERTPTESIEVELVNSDGGATED